jgi:hypothetical protein
MPQDPRRGANGLDTNFDTVRSGSPTKTPSDRKLRDPVTGKKVDGRFFSIGDQGRSIENDLNKFAKGKRV